MPPSAEATDGERPRKERKKDKAASPKKERRKERHRDEATNRESGPPPEEVATPAPDVQAGVGAGGGPRSSGVLLSSGARETGAKVVY